jgi:hypothetical protein
MTAGQLVRDTVEVDFRVTCTPPSGAAGTLGITAPTNRRPLPSATHYTIWYAHWGYWDYGGNWLFLGSLDPNGTLVTGMTASTEPDFYWYDFELRGRPYELQRTGPDTAQGPFLRFGAEIRSTSSSRSHAQVEIRDRHGAGLALSLPRSTFPKCVIGSESTKITSRGHL